MDADDLVAALRREGAAFSAAASRGLEPPVPSCPGWSVGQLMNHLGRVQRWATGVLRDGETDRPPFPPRPDELTVAWFDEGVADLAAALEDTGPDATVWTFTGLGPSRFWFVRMAAEAAVHRWDAELAHAEAGGGAAAPIDGALAVAGIHEVLGLQYAMGAAGAAARAPIDLGGTIHLHATDVEGEWLITVADGLLQVSTGHEKGDAAVRGAASDLLLLLWGRRPLSDLEAFGDTTVVERFLALGTT